MTIYTKLFTPSDTDQISFETGAILIDINLMPYEVDEIPIDLRLNSSEIDPGSYGIDPVSRVTGQILSNVQSTSYNTT
jgi:hypothetical protein